MKRIVIIFLLLLCLGFKCNRDAPTGIHWKGIAEDAYLFKVPANDSIIAWMAKCDSLNAQYANDEDLISRYIDWDQYLTIHDLLGVWSASGCDKSSDDFTLWRIEQFRRDTIKPKAQGDKFMILRRAIDSICSYEPWSVYEENSKAYLQKELQEFYNRQLFVAFCSGRSNQLKNALMKEEEAWQDYHATLDSTYHIVEGGPESFYSSGEYQALMHMLRDDALLREISLVDCLNYVGHHKQNIHRFVSPNTVLAEYKNFIDSIEEDEWSHPVHMRRAALENEMLYWNKWMQCRASVSELLDLSLKNHYDYSTNNARRMKYIMLKNRYNVTRLVSASDAEKLIPYSITDEDLWGEPMSENDRYQ